MVCLEISFKVGDRTKAAEDVERMLGRHHRGYEMNDEAFRELGDHYELLCYDLGRPIDATGFQFLSDDPRRASRLDAWSAELMVAAAYRLTSRADRKN